MLKWCLLINLNRVMEMYGISLITGFIIPEKASCELFLTVEQHTKGRH